MEIFDEWKGMGPVLSLHGRLLAETASFALHHPRKQLLTANFSIFDIKIFLIGLMIFYVKQSN